MDLSDHWQLDLGVRCLDAIPGTSVSAYVAGDVRLAWHPNARWECAVTGQNLLDNQHPEITPISPSPRVEIERSVFAKVSLKF